MLFDFISDLVGTAAMAVEETVHTVGDFYTVNIETPIVRATTPSEKKNEEKKKEKPENSNSEKPSKNPIIKRVEEGRKQLKAENEAKRLEEAKAELEAKRKELAEAESAVKLAEEAAKKAEEEASKKAEETPDKTVTTVSVSNEEIEKVKELISKLPKEVADNFQNIELLVVLFKEAENLLSALGVNINPEELMNMVTTSYHELMEEKKKASQQDLEPAKKPSPKKSTKKTA